MEQTLEKRASTEDFDKWTPHAHIQALLRGLGDLPLYHPALDRESRRSVLASPVHCVFLLRGSSHKIRRLGEWCTSTRCRHTDFSDTALNTLFLSALIQAIAVRFRDRQRVPDVLLRDSEVQGAGHSALHGEASVRRQRRLHSAGEWLRRPADGVKHCSLPFQTISCFTALRKNYYPSTVLIYMSSKRAAFPVLRQGPHCVLCRYVAQFVDRFGTVRHGRAGAAPECRYALVRPRPCEAPVPVLVTSRPFPSTVATLCTCE